MNGTSIIEANQNTTNINGKKDILPKEKLIICEIVYRALATRSVNIIIEMPVQRIASVTERLSIEINVTEEHLKNGTFEINLGQRDII
jgi:CMP-2-keto-3-deoxyoctulosonic acid synthetase